MSKTIAGLEKQNAELKEVAENAIQKLAVEMKKKSIKYVPLKPFADDASYNREIMQIFDSEEFKWFMYQMEQCAMTQFISSPDMTIKQKTAGWIEGFDLVINKMQECKKKYYDIVYEEDKGDNDEGEE